MSNSLLLNSLEIKNFRAFRHLQIERLGRVNLIVGKNNVGKTCLLEALWLYASRGEPTVMQQLLASRNELALFADHESKISAVKYLFYGRDNVEPPKAKLIEIGEDKSDETFFLSANAINEKVIELIKEDVQNAREIQKNAIGQAAEYGLSLPPDANLSSRLNRMLSANRRIKSEKVFSNPYNLILATKSNGYARLIAPDFKQANLNDTATEIPVQFIPIEGVGLMRVAEWWDKTYLTDLEDDVLAALKIIEPTITRIGLVPSQQQPSQRLPMVRLSREAAPILLSSLGQGMNALFALALALVNAKNGFLLIDEVENGIYHGIQPKLWHFILKMAVRLNVQVFATTHSRDSLEGFYEALREDKQADGLLISLRNKQDKPGEVVGILFERENLEIITRQHIEVR